MPFMSLYEQSRIYTVKLESVGEAREWTTTALAEMKGVCPLPSERRVVLWTATAFIISKWPNDVAAKGAAEIRDLLYRRTRTAEGLSVVTKVFVIVLLILLVTGAIRNGPERRDHTLKPW